MNKRHQRTVRPVVIMLAAIIAFMTLMGTGLPVRAADPGVEGFVERMYRVVLNREPDVTGFSDWTSQLESGEKAAADIVLGFFGSPEYLGLNKSNREVVTDFYSAMLDRVPDEEGANYWQQRLDVGMTMSTIAYGFVNSVEFTTLCERYGIRNGSVELTSARDYNFERTSFAYRLYKNCLGREPDMAGLENWCEQLSAGATGSDVAYGFIFSSEYLGKHSTNESFVDMMYSTILGREADVEGRESWADALNYSNTREHVFNGFLFSDEFAAQCQRAEINVGSPIYEPDGEWEWQNNIRVLELCNEFRQSEGLTRLATREDLWRDVACVRADELTEYFSHTRPDGRSCFTAYTEVGLSYYGAGENIAAGYGSPEEVVDGWMNSTGHRANILRRSFKYLGTGICGDNWCQNFMN